MAATLEQIRLGVAAKLQAALPGAQCNGYMLSQPTPPAIEIFPEEVDYHGAMQDGLNTWSLIVRGFCALSTDVGAQKQLDEWLASDGPTSIKAALEADPSLGGIVDDVTVQSADQYTLFLREGSPPMLGAEWHVEVMA